MFSCERYDALVEDPLRIPARPSIVVSEQIPHGRTRAEVLVTLAALLEFLFPHLAHSLDKLPNRHARAALYDGGRNGHLDDDGFDSGRRGELVGRMEVVDLVVFFAVREVAVQGGRFLADHNEVERVDEGVQEERRALAELPAGSLAEEIGVERLVLQSVVEESVSAARRARPRTAVAHLDETIEALADTRNALEIGVIELSFLEGVNQQLIGQLDGEIAV